MAIKTIGVTPDLYRHV